MDLIMAAKVRPVKVPNPSTKKDGRKEVRLAAELRMSSVSFDILCSDVPVS